MFTVGEFSRLARVSKRLLRYYDQIGLLKPVRIDPVSGYRYYSAEQMPLLNRILALKDLGLSLDQIQRLLNDNISADEMQGMLLLKKAEIEQQLQSELQRIRSIEARLQFIRRAEGDVTPDVVIKSIPAQPVLSVRLEMESLEAGLSIFGQIKRALPDTSKSPYGLYFAIMHSDGIEDESMDIEIGRMVEAKTHAPVPLHSGLELRFHELPAVETMATFVVQGPTANLLVGYSVIGTWAEIKGYRFAGVPREVALKMPTTPDWSDGMAEIQFPVERIS